MDYINDEQKNRLNAGNTKGFQRQKSLCVSCFSYPSEMIRTAINHSFRKSEGII